MTRSSLFCCRTYQKTLFPIVCGCGVNSIIYRSTLLTGTSCETIETYEEPCPPPMEECSSVEWRNNEALMIAINQRRCICLNDNRFFQESFRSCTSKAANGEVCSVQEIKDQQRAYSGAVANCPGQVVVTPCNPEGRTLVWGWNDKIK